ncbi:MAG: aminotransferase class I/II-fold pyridoxal phosphate-dependent enzyme [Trichodesmium sp. MAG_R04]|jgi:aspartate/methionine/tyrosine aminotransferase|nr:aminotransferase class I/II-fold pyridoxal phosphate-dependent enzyme [Trichodesmium sp. MAG_R04]
MNNILLNKYPLIFKRLSKVGQRVSFPEHSILHQAFVNKETKYNASVGTTTLDKKFLHLPSLTKYYNLPPSDVVNYTPIQGLYDLRLLYKERICSQNNLDGNLFGTPIITNGITNALQISSQLFLNPNDSVIIHNKYWENYDLIFNKIAGAIIKPYSMFNSDSKFDLESFEKILIQQTNNIFLIFNFPNNPTGYSPDRQTITAVAEIIKNVAENQKILISVLIDEAGYGFFFEEDICRESLFSILLKLKSEYIFPILAKGSTKEDLSYGIRVGSLSLGVSHECSSILEGKAAALIRGSNSTICTPSQISVYNIIKDPNRNSEFTKTFTLIKERYNLIKYEILPNLINNGFLEHYYIYPCNSGFFMTLKTKVNAFALQNKLRERNVGVTVLEEKHIRICFSSVDRELLSILFQVLLETARDMVH